MVQFRQPVNYSADNVRELRRLSGMSRREVVEKLAEQGISLHQTSLRRIEEGQQSVKIEEAQAFAEIFNIDLADFITRPINEVESLVQNLLRHGIDDRMTLQLYSDGYVLWLERVAEVLESPGTPPPEQSRAVRKLRELYDWDVRMMDTLKKMREHFDVDPCSTDGEG